MSTGVNTVEVDKHLATGAEKMDGEEIRRSAVVEDGRLVRVLSHGNLVQAAQGRCPGERVTLA